MERNNVINPKWEIQFFHFIKQLTHIGQNTDMHTQDL